MQSGYYPGMDDRNNANQLYTSAPSVPAADHVIPGKAKENDGSNFAGLLMHLVFDRSEGGTSTPTDKEASTTTPAPTEKVTGTILPTAG